MSILWSLHLRREAASVPLARRLLISAMEAAGVDPDISYDLSVALSEACANAVAHGGGGSAAGTPGAFQVTAYLDGERCRIEVADSGPGFPSGLAHARSATELGGGSARAVTCPTPLSAEHGRGLCLIEELADHVHFGNKPGRGGAVVSFDKSLKWRTDGRLVAV